MSTSPAEPFGLFDTFESFSFIIKYLRVYSGFIPSFSFYSINHFAG